MKRTREASKSAVHHEEGKQGHPLISVIDIGSNSVRLVVYRGILRHPQILFNEKALCGLGRSVSATGRMDDEAVELAISTLRRFRILCDDMGVHTIKALATAAVREADNGDEFVRRVESECGFGVTVLTGMEEARLSAMGVLSSFPDANGVMGDLGGGSLELVEIKGGEIGERVSLPIGPLRLLGVEDWSDEERITKIHQALDQVEWLSDHKKLGFYLVGGAWRTMMRLHLESTDWPIPTLHGYALTKKQAAGFASEIAQYSPNGIRRNFALDKLRRGIPDSRIETLPLAAEILRGILARMKPAEVHTSGFGLREGALFADLKESERHEHPLLAACTDISRRTSRFPEHSDKLMAWTDPVFVDETALGYHLRMAACLLSDISWRGHPDFRAESAYNSAMYSRFVGIDHTGRAFLSLALFICFGGDWDDPYTASARQILDDQALGRARLVGFALRLGQRLTGGTSLPLEESRIVRKKKSIRLELPADQMDLASESVVKRLAALAQQLGVKPKIRKLVD